MKPDLYYCIAAYNEEDNIENCLDSLAQQDFNGNLETIICLNDCTDKTEGKILKSREKHDKLNIQIIHSEKGIAFAQNAIGKHVTNKHAPLLFVDADVTLDTKCTGILYEELNENSHLIVAGAWPVPIKPEKMSLWESFLFHILHVRANYPESEVSVNDVSEFKKFADEHPQPAISVEFEKKSKIYFHGRAFIVRNTDLYDIPARRDVCDDTYMPNLIHTKHGPGTIRTRYDALVFYKPYTSLKEHFKIYRRIFLDLRHIDQTNEAFRESREMERTKLDWQYILEQGLSTTAKFITYATITRFEELCYLALPKKCHSDMWIYKKK